jgi:hypothetical protein
MPTKVIDREVMIFRYEEFGLPDKYLFYSKHKINQQGYVKSAPAEATEKDIQVDECHYEINSPVSQGGGDPAIHSIVHHLSELQNFPLSGDGEFEYVFDVYVVEGGTPLDLADSVGTPPDKQRVIVKKKNIRIMEIKDLGKG